MTAHQASSIRFRHESPADGQHLLFSPTEIAGNLAMVLIQTRKITENSLNIKIYPIPIFTDMGPDDQIFGFQI